MKIEFELPSDYENDDILFLCSVEDPSPIAFLNVYEKGDVWIKTESCEGCTDRGRELCCRGCPMVTELGCFLHLPKSSRGSKKPFGCVTIPSPEKCMSYCNLQFTSVRGSKKGKIRKVSNPGNIFD